MNRFLIGMYGGFDENKFKRDFRPGFFGIEACMFPGESDVERLVGEAGGHGFKFGVHYPFIKKDTPYRDPLLLSLDPDERRAAWESFEKETRYAASKGAVYILTHFPKPVLIDRSFDLKHWRFAGDREWMLSENYPKGRLNEAVVLIFQRLDEIARNNGIAVLLENDVVSGCIAQTHLLPALFKEYSRIGMCLDMGRLHLQEKVDPGFEAGEFVQRVAPHVRLVHLWNSNLAGNLSGGHYPVLPGQSPEEGWADLRQYFDILNSTGQKPLVLFEHRSDRISDEELDNCYRYVKEHFV